MKPSLPLLCLTALCCLAVAPSSLDAEPTPDQPEAKSGIEVTAKSAEFDLGTRTAIYRGDVRATDPQMNLRCELLTALWSETNHITSIVAERSVEIEIVNEQGTNRAFADHAVYDAETDLVVLTGTTKPRIITKLGTLTADRVVVDRTKNKLRGEGNFYMLMPAESLRQSKGTNATAKPGLPPGKSSKKP